MQLFGTKGQKFLHCPGTKGQRDKLKILPRDGTGRDFDRLSRPVPGRDTGQLHFFCYHCYSFLLEFEHFAFSLDGMAICVVKFPRKKYEIRQVSKEIGVSLDSVVFWSKIYLILYPFLGNLTTHNAHFEEERSG